MCLQPFFACVSPESLRCLLPGVPLAFRSPAGPEGEEADAQVQCQEGSGTVAAPLHPGEQPRFGGLQETLWVPELGELPERDAYPRDQGGR